MTIAMMALMMSMMMLIPDTKQLGGLCAKDLQRDLKSYKWVVWGGPIDGEFDDVFGDLSTISPL